MKFLLNSSRFAIGILLAIILLSNSAVATNNNVDNVKKLHVNSTLPSDPTMAVQIPAFKSAIKAVGNSSQMKQITGNEPFGDSKKSVKTQGGKKSIADFDPNSLPGIPIGTTYYDFQTNASMPNRLSYYEDGTKKYVQFIWMADQTVNDGTEYLSRGTYYELLEVTDPTNPDTKNLWDSRIEGSRAGFPSIIQFPDGKMGTPSHNPTSGSPKLLFTKNSGFKSTTFNTDIIDDTYQLMWPRAAIDKKEYVHIIATNNELTSVNYSQYYYLRSTDGGTSFESPVLLTSKDANNGGGAGGDSYAITARENTVVIAYWDHNSNVIYRKSDDNGDNWPVFKGAFLRKADSVYIKTDLGDGNVEYTTDPVPAPGSNIDVILDSKLNAHFIFNAISIHSEGKGKIESDTITRVDTTKYSGAYYKIAFFYNFEGNTTLIQTAGCPTGSDTNGIDPNSTATRMTEYRRYGSSFVCTPQLGIDAEDNIYCVYGGENNTDVADVRADLSPNLDGSQVETVSGYISHLYLMMKPADWNHFGTSVNLTPDGADCGFPSMCDTVVMINGEKYMFIGYNADGTPGDKISNIQLPQDEETYILFYAVPVSKLDGTVPVEEQKIITTTSMKILPNPVSDNATVTISNSSDRNNVQIAIYNVLGNKVASLHDGAMNAGNFAFRFNTQSLSAGVYYCSFVSNGEKITKMINVVR